MDIVYALDQKYAPHAASSIASILRYTTREEIGIWILSYALPKEDREKLESMGPISCIDTGDFADRLYGAAHGEVDAGRFSLATYIRLFAGELLPDHVRRYLYLDSDTISLSSVEGLYSFDMAGRPIALAPEPTIYSGLREELGLQTYFNAGVMLVDRTVWRERGCQERCLEYLSQHRGGLMFHDQDILNAVLGDEIAPLPQKYNFLSNYYYRSYESLIRRSPWYAAVQSRAGYEETPVIVHFAGDERPWYRGSRSPYLGEYEKCLELTPYAGTLPEGGHELYMGLYHMMNVMTKAAPGIRDRISEMYFKRLSR